MYHPDQYYQQHMRHLDELRERAEHSRMVAALTRGQPASARAALVRLGVRLGAWLAAPARPAEQPACTCEC